MKTIFERVVSMMLAMVMLVGLTVPASAADYTCSTYEECTEDGAEVYIITKDNCAIRTEPNGDAPIAARGKAGQLVSVSDVFWTARFARWAEINVIGSDEILYCYIENIERHDTHAIARVLETDNGFVEFCTVCGFCMAMTDEEKASCNLACVADQAIWGTMSDYNPSFWGVVAQIIVGELPGAGTIADARDLIGDIQNGESMGVIAMDCFALIPFAGMLKYADELSFAAKNTDKVNDVAKAMKHAPNTNKVNDAEKVMKYLPWGAWEDYDKVTRGGKEYVKLGDFYYSRHAVDEFTPAYIKSNKINGVEHSRGISPTFVNWMITDGVAEGVTTVSDARNGYKMYTNGIFEVVVDKDVVVTIVRKG